MQFVSITQFGSSYGITLPIDILRHAGLIEETGEGQIPHLKGDDLEVFVQYNPETRMIEFQLPEPPEGAATREEALVQEEREQKLHQKETESEESAGLELSEDDRQKLRNGLSSD